MKNILLGIEGQIGSGKTTVAKTILKNYKKFIYFSVGGLYSQIAELALRGQIDLYEEQLKKLKITYKITQDRIVKFLINGQTISIYHDKITNREMIYRNYDLFTLCFSQEIKNIIKNEIKNWHIIYDGRNQIRILGKQNIDIHAVIEANNNIRYDRMRIRDGDNPDSAFLKRDRFELGLHSIYDRDSVRIDSTNLSKSDVYEVFGNLIQRKLAEK